MSDRLQELTAFVRAAETGSFSRVAREFGVSQPSVSRMVASLEARIGVKLLLRTTRQVTLTDAGTAFLERARQVLGDLDEAENLARGVDSLSGLLRIALSGAFGTREVIPHLPAFLAQHPKLKIELQISDRAEDLVAEGADMALRLGALTDSSFGARLLGRAPRLAVASPAYLAARGTPRMLTDLSAHDCLTGPGHSGRRGWSFKRSGTLTSIEVEGPVRVASAEGLIACTKASLGIAIVSRWMCRAELEAGTLVPVLTDYELDAVDVHALYPGGRRPSSKVRAFSDYLASKISE
ncbi:LysR substrate-binding domain-containing protein [Bradyrhizobium sp. SYSU BS000235]|uniref:LysR family transcriptional regulator n=1 Tax=Bradyrhizobium sp. SYSU BS000235 TaxID=3411332 RepID=UPI003C791AE0